MTDAYPPRRRDAEGSSVVINNAVAILAARHGSNHNLAYDMLRSATNDGRSLLDVAQAVVGAADTPSSRSRATVSHA